MQSSWNPSKRAGYMCNLITIEVGSHGLINLPGFSKLKDHFHFPKKTMKELANVWNLQTCHFRPPNQIIWMVFMCVVPIHCVLNSSCILTSSHWTTSTSHCMYATYYVHYNEGKMKGEKGGGKEWCIRHRQTHILTHSHIFKHLL